MKTKIKTLLVAAAAITGSFALEARTFDLTAWRGETVSALVPDFCEFGEMPPNLKIKIGSLAPVQYAPAPNSLQRLTCMDRVVWGDIEGRPRVVEIEVPADTKPGVYKCGMMSLRIIDRVLPPPKEWKYYLDLWQHPWAVSRTAGVKPFSKEHYAAMRPVYELLASAGQKTITVSLLEAPWDHQCHDVYHSMVEGDFKLFDEYVEFCLSCGLGPDISCYSLCPWTLGRDIDEKALEERWGAFLDRFAAHVKAKGWFKNTLMAMDERKPEDVAKVASFVQRHAPGMRISMAGNRNPKDFKGITIDIYSQVLWAYCLTPEFIAEAEARRKQGYITTLYVCCTPSCPNTFMSSGPGEAFWCGASPALLGLDGFLRWAWNSWPQDPCKDASYGNWRSGDTFLCYPNGEPSWRFLDLRNGIIAAEKIRILKESGHFADKIAELAKKYDVKAANDNQCDFPALKRETLDLVNQ